MTSVLESVSDQSFEQEVVQSKLPVLVDFWAEWCGPCKAIAPTVDAIASEYQGKVKIVKINVAENQTIPAKYNIRHIPALLLFKDGKMIATKVGGELSKPELANFIDSNI